MNSFVFHAQHQIQFNIDISLVLYWWWWIFFHSFFCFRNFGLWYVFLCLLLLLSFPFSSSSASVCYFCLLSHGHLTYDHIQTYWLYNEFSLSTSCLPFTGSFPSICTLYHIIQQYSSQFQPGPTKYTVPFTIFALQQF